MAGDGGPVAKRPKLQGETSTKADAFFQWVRSEMQSEPMEKVTSYVEILRANDFNSVEELARFKSENLEAASMLKKEGITLKWASHLLQKASENTQAGNSTYAAASRGPNDRDLDARVYDAIVRGIAVASKQMLSADKTYASHAARVKADLRNNYCVISEEGEGPPFMTEDECNAARASIYEPDRHESYLVAHMTPIFLERLTPSFPAHCVLVNGEQYHWIPQSSGLKKHDLAPDHIISPHYLIRFRKPYKDAPFIENGEYGSFPVFRARTSLVAIGHAKKKLTEEKEGEFMTLLECLSSREKLALRGFVYDWQTCSLMTAVNGRITQITTVKWVTPGSRAHVYVYFKGFESDWDCGLKLACKAFSVTLPRYSSAHVVADGCVQCILGAGAFGRVFVVMREVAGCLSGPLALKLVLGKECSDSLAHEFELLKNLPSKVQNDVICLDETPIWRGILEQRNRTPLDVSAFLMRNVGQPLRDITDVSESDGPRILETLSNLHAAKVSHNDARYNNVVRIEMLGPPKTTGFRWIDLRTGRGLATSRDFALDIMTFLKSLNRRFDEEHINNYAKKVADPSWTLEERHAAARKLWNCIS